MRMWIKDPIAILAEGAGCGVVVDDGRIVELVPLGAEPEARVDRVFDASRHVVIPGLINTHHHMFQTLTRAYPAALNKELFPWLDVLFPIWAKHLNPDNFRLAARLALTELLMSGCTAVSRENGGSVDGAPLGVDVARLRAQHGRAAERFVE
jgi:8-oxoguanine deaminase